MEQNRLRALAVKGSKIRTSADNFNNFKNRGGWHTTVPGFACIAQLVIRTIVGHLTPRNLSVNGLSMVNLVVEKVNQSTEIKTLFDELLGALCDKEGFSAWEGDFDLIRFALLKKMCNARIGEFVMAHEGIKGVRMALRAALKSAKA